MSLKSSFYRNQHSRLPPLPKTRTEIRVEGDWTKTLTGKNFLLLHLSFPTSPSLHDQWLCWRSAVITDSSPYEDPFVATEQVRRLLSRLISGPGRIKLSMQSVLGWVFKANQTMALSVFVYFEAMDFSSIHSIIHVVCRTWCRTTVLPTISTNNTSNLQAESSLLSSPVVSFG